MSIWNQNKLSVLNHRSSRHDERIKCHNQTHIRYHQSSNCTRPPLYPLERHFIHHSSAQSSKEETIKNPINYSSHILNSSHHSPTTHTPGFQIYDEGILNKRIGSTALKYIENSIQKEGSTHLPSIQTPRFDTIGTQTNSFDSPFMNILVGTNTTIPDTVKNNGVSFNINKMGRTRSYVFNSCIDIGMDAFRKSLFGTDEEKEEERLKSENDFF